MNADYAPAFGNVDPLWLSADSVTIRESACILANIDPATCEATFALPGKANTMRELITRALLAGNLPCFAAKERCEPDSEYSSRDARHVGPHTDLADDTTVLVTNLAAWCETKGIAHPFRARADQTIAAPARSLDRYPEQLRAAIEAFEALRHDSGATAGKSAKDALMAWLETNTNLGKGARERVAIIANWQPKGGAPKTPIRKPTPQKAG